MAKNWQRFSQRIRATNQCKKVTEWPGRSDLDGVPDARNTPESILILICSPMPFNDLRIFSLHLPIQNPTKPELIYESDVDKNGGKI
jgi:hypothetical protein